MYLITKLKGYFTKKKNEALDDEARMKSVETRKLQAEIAQLKKQVDMKKELQDMREFLAGDVQGKSNPEDMFLNLIMSKMLSPTITTPNQQPLNISSNTNTTVTEKDTELKAIAEKVAAVIPNQYIPVIQSYNDEELIKIKNFAIELKKGI